MATNHVGNVLAQFEFARQIVADTIEPGTVPNKKQDVIAARTNRTHARILLMALAFFVWPFLSSKAQSASATNSSTPASSAQTQVCKDVQISDAAKASNTVETTTIEAPICGYFEALNHSDIEAVLKLYTDDPVMLPFLLPTVVGPEAVRDNYKNTFRQIRFQMHTTIQEVVQMSPEWAFARTDSAGLFTPIKTGKGAPSTFHELFLLRKGTDGKWRIARYNFSPTSALPVI
jgi:uncharacterized protein (TIGR02246 family)